MIKFLFGILIGIALTHYDVVPHITTFFIESGVRDNLIETLQNVK